MRWLNCAVEGQAHWPDKETEVEFDGHKLVLLPRTDKNCASVHIYSTGIEIKDALTIINRFLSTICWKDDEPMINHYGLAGSVKPAPMPKDACRNPFGYSPVQYYPEKIVAANDFRSRLALALYREGKSLNSVPYQFLSYFKILNIFWRHKNEIVEGINNVLDKINDEMANKRLVELRQKNKDLGKYLYESGRCAIAHAYAQPIADPDDVSDLRRLSNDIYLIKEIAGYLVENELKIPRNIWE